jgi:hypothetical protein
MTPVDTDHRRLPGAAFFQIEPTGERMSKAPYVMCVAGTVNLSQAGPRS